MFTKPWLYLPAECAHKLSPLGLKIFSLIKGSSTPSVWNPFKYQNLFFPNRLGIAGGVDKNGTQLYDWQRLGCGFVEIGTITPKPQTPNDGIILRRDLQSRSVWNKMGFPSPGSDICYHNLLKIKDRLKIPVFVNIGKNRTTSNESAHNDYTQLIHQFYDIADAFVINISSPNTQGLRELAQPHQLSLFLKPIIDSLYDKSLKKPLFLKISPDLDYDLLCNIIQSAIEFKLDGFILTNTTTDRLKTNFYPQEGGVSGFPLKDRSIQALKWTKSILNEKKSKKIIISVGGVMTAEDVFERIEAGADLVQVYSTLIFEGPGFFRKVAHIAQQDSSKTAIQKAASPS